ncbi:MAG: diguanylate cyclase [Eubacterium sp.]|nr:diguanylate cyclase [Eubacterium sp.]
MRMSLKIKVICFFIIFTIIIGITGIAMYRRVILDIVMKEYEEQSVNIAKAMAQTVDAERVRNLRDAVMKIYNETDEKVLSDQWGTPEFNAYIARFSEIEKSEDFLVLREQLRRVQDVINVDCLYILWLDVPGKRMIYLVDAAHEGACPPGCADPLFTDDPDAILNNPEIGTPPNITHTPEYGYLLTASMPVYTSDNEFVGYTTVDISMNEIIAHEQQLIIIAAVIFLFVAFLIGLAGILLVDRFIVRPINKLSDVAETYTQGEANFSELDIRTGDEIETLAESMKQMEKDLTEYMENLISTRSDLATVTEKAEFLNREANIDALTGLRNKRAYDLAVADLDNGNTAYAIVMIDLNDLKMINDKYGHDKGDIAIKNLAALIRRVFTHSPVYRIGGDEFVVLLDAEVLAMRESLIGRFRDEVRALSQIENRQVWEKVSAACGYAVYDPEKDQNSRSVFKRADEDMYKHKAEMKNTK